MEEFHKEKNTEREAEIKRLREELAKAVEQIEDEFSLQRIDELTAKLESLEGTEEKFNAKQAKAEFFQKYYHLVEEWEEENRQREHKGRRSKQSGLGRKMKAAMVLAAAFLCLNGATVAIAGMNLFEAVFRWDAETFQVSMENGQGNMLTQRDNERIQNDKGTAWTELEADFGAEIPLIGEFVGNMEITEMECTGKRKKYADVTFFDGDKEYHYSAKKLEYRDSTMYVEKTGEEPIKFDWDGITYYFVQNRRWMSIVWQYENQVYVLSGDFDEERAKIIVESIEYEEELS